MFKRRYKYKYGLRKSKKRYSNETTSFTFKDTGITGTTTGPVKESKLGQILVQSATLQGTRKVKNMTLSITSFGNTVPLYCAVVYCPGGTAPSSLTPGSDSLRVGSELYEPNQNVIMQFMMNPVKTDTMVNTQVQTFKTRLARNLDSNDYIALIYCPAIASATDQDIQVSGTFNYAIAY